MGYCISIYPSITGIENVPDKINLALLDYKYSSWSLTQESCLEDNLKTSSGMVEKSRDS